VRPAPLIAAVVLLALAALAAVLAFDVRAWSNAFDANDARFQATPRQSDWQAETTFPADVAERLLAVRDDVELRQALQAFVIADRTPRAFGLDERKARARSAAEAMLAEVSSTAVPTRASQAQNLVGVLVHRTGRVADGTTGEDRTIAAFETAVRLDPGNNDAKYNLELMLRRARPTGTREGPNTGSGPRGPGRRGAGAGTPGRGY
jgi:hypothetical protein